MADAYWQYVKALLHCDGTDGSTVFTDAAGHTFSANGNAQMDTAQQRFGSAGMLLDGSGDFVSSAPHADWNFGALDWTVEAFIRTSAASDQAIHSTDYGAYDLSCLLYVRSNGKLEAVISHNGTTLASGIGATTVNDGAWHHVALAKTGATARIFVDGALDATITLNSATVYRHASADLQIGRRHSSQSLSFNGHIDEYRLTIGHCRYTAAFTPPTAAFDDFGFDVAAITAALRFLVYATGAAAAPISFEVQHTQGLAVAALRFLVHQVGPAGAPITFTVNLAERASAPLAFSVAHVTGGAAAPLRILVSQAGQAAATLAIAVTDGQTRDWGVRVLLDGAQVGSLLGTITVRAEEGAARIARLALRAPAGPVNPIAYTGRAVQIDLLRAGVPLRLFTGRVDLPDYDPNTRVIGLACTDDLQNRVAALTRAEIDALTGGGYHRAVHGEIDDHWDYAQACMLTHPASLDAGPHGGLRVTAWEDLPVWRTYTLPADQSPRIELPRRAEIVNRVDVAFAYRYHRLRERRMSVSWHMSWFLTEAEAAGFQYPTIASCLSALGGAGWTLYSAIFYPCPASVPYGGGTVTPTGEVGSLAAQLWQRHGQTVTETTTLTVTAPESIAANGEIGRELRATLASEWTPDGWETDITLAPADVGAGLDYAPDADRADAEAGMQAALDQAKTLILARHRDTRLSFDLPCAPEIDLDRAIGFDWATPIAGIEAVGKVWAVEHALDPAAGSAITTVTLALSGVAAAGLATPTVTPLVPPDPPDIEAVTGPDDWAQPHVTSLIAGLSAYDDAVSGWIIHAPEKIQVSTGAVDNPWYDGSEYPETGFRVALPGVPESHRNPLEIAAAAAYEIAIPEDTLTLQ